MTSKLLSWDGTEPFDYEPSSEALASATSLTDLANVFGSDKGNVDSAHRYTEVYERLITREGTSALCEIGVACGASLKMWSRYLPEARIVGIDIRPACAQVCRTYPNIDIVISSVTSLDYSDQFDVVIDDASHIAEDVVAFAEHAIRWVKPGGLYIIEDLMCTYHHVGYTEEYNSRFQTNKSNDRSVFTGFVDRLLRKIDGKSDIESLQYHPELLIIRKSS